MRQVARSRHDDAANLEAGVESTTECIRELVRRALQVVEEGRKVDADAPERHVRQLLVRLERAGDARVEAGLGAAAWRASPCRERAGRTAPLAQEQLERAGSEDRVGGG